MEGITKDNIGYIINGTRVYYESKLWDYSLKRTIDFEEKCKSKEEFEKKMLTRLKRIKNDCKIYYAIAVLIERGHHEIAEIYDSRLILNLLSDDFD